MEEMEERIRRGNIELERAQAIKVLPRLPSMNPSSSYDWRIGNVRNCRRSSSKIGSSWLVKQSQSLHAWCFTMLYSIIPIHISTSYRYVNILCHEDTPYCQMTIRLFWNISGSLSPDIASAGRLPIIVMPMPICIHPFLCKISLFFNPH